MARRETISRVNGIFSGDHSDDECQGVLFPIPRFNPGLWGGRNFFVLVAQLFQKTPALKELAPTQTEPPFAISQGIVLLLFIVLGIAAVCQSASSP
jgi:hypothetical protein